MPMPCFSVVIPTYNRALKLTRAIQSVLNQSFYDFQLFVVDDGSVDGTREAVESFRDSRIRYDWIEHSGGPEKPRNRGIALATGDWISFLDDDDVWYFNKLETVWNAITNNDGIDVFFHALTNGYKSIERPGPCDNFYKVLLTKGNRLGNSGVTVKREFLNRHSLRLNESEKYALVEDYELWLKIALHGGRFYFIEARLGEMTRGDDNISSDMARLLRNQLYMLREHVFEHQTFEADKEKLWRQVKVMLAVPEIKEHVLRGDYMAALQMLARVFAESPQGSIAYSEFCVRRKIRSFSARLKSPRDSMTGLPPNSTQNSG